MKPQTLMSGKMGRSKYFILYFITNILIKLQLLIYLNRTYIPEWNYKLSYYNLKFENLLLHIKLTIKSRSITCFFISWDLTRYQKWRRDFAKTPLLSICKTWRLIEWLRVCARLRYPCFVILHVFEMDGLTFISFS